MANGTQQTQNDEENVASARKKSGSSKKAILLVVWLVMLGGLIFWIKTVGDTGGPAFPGTAPKNVPARKLDAAILETQWPQIVAHAAAPPRGNPAAQYTIAEFGDFQCPMCGKVYPVLESLLKKYPKQVNLIFLHRPFPQMHQWALPAGQASEIAAAQGKFWPMYDTLYSNQDNLEPGYYSTYAEQVGLNKAQFKAAFDAGTGQSQMKVASAFADSLNVQETPTILLRDNTAKTVTIYIGTIGTKNANGSPQYPGVQSIATNPPWK